jgi:hypothetical protein
MPLKLEYNFLTFLACRQIRFVVWIWNNRAARDDVVPTTGTEARRWLKRRCGEGRPSCRRVPEEVNGESLFVLVARGSVVVKALC